MMTHTANVDINGNSVACRSLTSVNLTEVSIKPTTNEPLRYTVEMYAFAGLAVTLTFDL